MVLQTMRSGISTNIAKVARILSVDDEPAILRSRTKILEYAGYEVLNAADGEEALRIFADYSVDLVLLDYSMPKMNGGVVAYEMKQCRQTVPIVMVTASPVSEETLSWVDCFLVKGGNPGLILDKVKQLLGTPSTYSTNPNRTPCSVAAIPNVGQRTKVI